MRIPRRFDLPAVLLMVDSTKQRIETRDQRFGDTAERPI
jgi:hypothetical protein